MPVRAPAQGGLAVVNVARRAKAVVPRRAAFVSIMAAAGIAWAQSPEAKPEGKPAAKATKAQESLTFKASASAVRVDVQVWNGRQPVSGLHDGDFVLREEGVVKTVEYFGGKLSRCKWYCCWTSQAAWANC